MNAFIQYHSANCVDCNRCIRHCPVKAIRYNEGKTEILEDHCIYCANCVVQCPQQAKTIRSDLQTFERMLQEEQVIVLLAPSYVASFDQHSLEAIAQAFKQIGVHEVLEVAQGAKQVKSAYEAQLKAKGGLLISSCCPSVNRFVQNEFPHLVDYLAKVLSPMEATATLAKQDYPHAKVVFVGPCLSKKVEAQESNGLVDLVLTFEEVESLFAKRSFAWLQEKQASLDPKLSRFFPEAGGIIKTLEPQKDTTYIALSGIESIKEALASLPMPFAGNLFLELSACEGSCIKGPALKKTSAISAQLRLQAQGASERKDDFETEELELHKTFAARVSTVMTFSDAQIQEVLAHIGKFEPKDELNCGACGYQSCKEKAQAVLQGKAQEQMCLPFMKKRAMSIANQVMDISPNVVIAVDTHFQIQLFNQAAHDLFALPSGIDLIGKSIDPYFPIAEFAYVLEQLSISEEQKYLEHIDKYVDLHIIYNPELQLVMLLMKDISQEVELRKKRMALQQETFEITNSIVHKQMRIVQEIASLLGETTAETKLALTQLKELIRDDE
ncbi:MAG: [Fe-Fe] hydrogenase large subunit C-terminal domain-containing protein [Erysipelotrichaceae bacterium]